MVPTRSIFSWWAADTADGAYEQVATGDTFTVTEACANRYLKVVAQAKKGIPGSDRCETKSGRILPMGATTLASVEFVNASKGAKDTGSTIEACAYKAVDFFARTGYRGRCLYVALVVRRPILLCL